MKITTYNKIGTRQVTKTRIIQATYDDAGNELTQETTEPYTEDVPIMAPVTRDMTDAEEASYLSAQAVDMQAPEQTDAERIASLEQQIALLLGGDTH